VLATSTRLEGSIFNWFELHVREYIELKLAKYSTKTNKIFTSYNYFTEELGKVFRDIDEKKSATYKLLQLQQTGSASTYTTKFYK
jgi:hypothetical protein